MIEFKLGVRGDPDLPDRNRDAWCGQIDRMTRRDGTSPEARASARPGEGPAGPSFACDGVTAGSTEAMVCEDEELSALDRELAEAYVAASEVAVDEHPPLLTAEQRGWIKGRNECWKSEAPRTCIRDAYVHRLAELQARYRLVPSTGPIFFACGDAPGSEVVATFFRTAPPTMIAERGDSVSLMYLQPSASGSRYQGRNESFWEHQGEASITWGHGAPQMRCRRNPEGAAGTAAEKRGTGP
mgnify:CR=1 FL=1